MSFWIMFTIMLIAGTCGGIINYYLPLNNPEPGKFLDKIPKCIILGLGATLLVPIFLELAQSKLMEKVHFGWDWQVSITGLDSARRNDKPDTVFVNSRIDSATKKVVRVDTVRSKKSSELNAAKTNQSATDGAGAGKHYFLWAAYCILAGAAGFRFINMLISNVVKSGEMSKVKTENQELKKEKVFREMNSQQSQTEEIAKVHAGITKEKVEQITAKGPIVGPPGPLDEVIEIPVMPALPPVKHPEDPQKGRFGGRSEANGRRLSAVVEESNLPDFYKVILTVESTQGNPPLNADVIFYIHDSFNPSVFTYKPAEFINGKAIEDEILSYGAFTVGVITDNGKTMLELDLSEDKKFPKLFRER